MQCHVHPWCQSQCYYVQHQTGEGWSPLIFVCCILRNTVLLDKAENGDMKLLKPHLPEDIERNTVSFWIDLWCKQMDIKCFDSWIFQCGFFLTDDDKYSITSFWHFIFPELCENVNISLVMKMCWWWHWPFWFLHYQGELTWIYFVLIRQPQFFKN